MTQAVLYVCHGSRVPKARKEAIQFIELIKPKVNASIQEVCFLELAEPSIETGFTACVNKGATEIAVVPLLLLTAVHAKKDIPVEIAHVSAKYPQVNITYGKPIGVDDRLTDMLIDKMEEKAAIAEDSVAILVGRGSTDLDVVHDLSEISKKLDKKTRLKRVQTCYLTAAEPKFEDTIDDLYQSNEKSIYIIPYLIFTGLLKQDIDETIKKYDWGTRQIRVCSYLGPHPILLQVFLERVNEAITNKEGFYTFERQCYL